MSANSASADNSLSGDIHPLGVVKPMVKLPFTTEEIRKYIPNTVSGAKLIERCHNAAAEMHENWRREFEKEKGIGTQRFKPIKEDPNDPRAQEMIDQLTSIGAKPESDINCPYEKLLNQFKEFNLQSALFMCGAMIAVQSSALACSPQLFYELVHQDWLDRSPYAHSGPLDVPWCWLPKVEQDKDVAVCDICVKHLCNVVDDYCKSVLLLA